MFLLKNTIIAVAAVLVVVCVSVPSTYAEVEPEAESKMGNTDGVAQYMGYGSNGLGYGYNAQPNQYMVPPYPYGGNQGGNYYGGYPPGYNPVYNQGYNPGYPGNYPINNPGYPGNYPINNPGYPGNYPMNNQGYPYYNQYSAEGGQQEERA